MTEGVKRAQMVDSSCNIIANGYNMKVQIKKVMKAQNIKLHVKVFRSFEQREEDEGNAK
jgi:hypothetical protein